MKDPERPAVACDHDMLTGRATVLLVEDVARAAAYYRDAPGFAVGAYDENPSHYA